jgi:membrane-bound serine protease (ClpP class)
MILTWSVIVVLLFVVGVVLVALEAFVLPGFGVPGVFGAAALLGAAATAWLKLGPMEGVFSLLASVGTLALLAWYLPRSKVGQALVLSEVQRGTAVSLPPQVRQGLEGVAVTALRPAGLAEFADLTVDVVSDGLFVEPGTRLRVKRVEGSRVVVEPAPNYRGG